MSDYINSSELFYSEISPKGIYAHYANDDVFLPIPDILNNVNTSPVLTNILSHEKFYCKKVYICSYSQKKALISEIINPSTQLASWPVDLIRVEESNEEKEHFEPINLHHRYCDEYHNVYENKANYIILFPYNKNDPAARGGYAYYTPLDTWMKKVPIAQRTYTNDKIKKICLSIVRSIAEFNREGYVYYDFSLSRFMVSNDFCVIPEYTNLIAKNKVKNISLSAHYGFMPLDFIDPYLYFLYNCEKDDSGTEIAKGFDLSTQNYSLAAMLFYLMFGRKPYDGLRLMQHQDDDANSVSHYAYLRNLYLLNENIHFIFDESYENPNQLINDYTDIFTVDINLWNNCPEELRKLFIYALQRQSALREPYSHAPKPNTWVTIFEKLGWGDLK